jgi:hypothetical protein
VPQLVASRTFEHRTRSFSIATPLQIQDIASLVLAIDQRSVCLQSPSLNRLVIGAFRNCIAAAVAVRIDAREALAENMVHIPFRNEATRTSERAASVLLCTALVEIGIRAIEIITQDLTSIAPQQIARRTAHHTASAFHGSTDL